MLLDKQIPVELENGRLPLRMSLFANDALILDGAAGKTVELHGKKTGKVLTVRFADFAYLGLWTKFMPFDTNYICIEPWSSLPDFADLDTELVNKVGIRRLAAGQSEVLRYSIDLE